MKSCQLSVVSCQIPFADAALRTPHCPPPTAHFPLHTARRGVSLLEVLAAIGVLSIGLLGLAALLPIGRYTIAEAVKGDRAGDCGRAGLRDVIVRRMLDPNAWNGNRGTSQSFLIDPRGILRTAPGGPLGPFGGIVPRLSLRYQSGVNASGSPIYAPFNSGLADQVFVWPDDLVLTMPEDMTPKQPIGRPSVMLDANNKPINQADYSWFATVTPMPIGAANPTQFSVSIVVCYKRVLAAASERAVPVQTFFDQAPVNGSIVALGGGSIKLTREVNDIASDVTAKTTGIAVKENDWVALCNSQTGLCRWYRIASIGDDSSYLTLIGPDWTPTPGKDNLVALAQSVIGVYTTTVELDTDPTWKN